MLLNVEHCRPTFLQGNSALFVHLHEGDYDEQMPWPFNQDYTVQVGEVISQITQRDSYMHYTSQGRPPHELSWGWANFCTLDAFKEAIRQGRAPSHILLTAFP